LAGLAFWKDHPPGLVICFLTEMWERFSYYGMRALLVLYLTQHFLYADEQAYLIYGTYTAMVYMLPVIGGMLADRYLGFRRAVTYGAILLVTGHFGLAIEGPAVMQGSINTGADAARDPFYANMFFLSLAFIATGVGFLKTNVSALVGTLYPADDPKRDAGYTVFYVGINIGGAAAPLLCGWLGQAYGWSYGFGLAGIGMILGLTAFLWGQKYLGDTAEPPRPDVLQQRILPLISIERLIYGLGLLVVAAAWMMFLFPQLVSTVLYGTGGLLGLYILYYAAIRCTAVERDRLLACLGMLLFLVVFLAFYEQMGSSMSIFADRMVDRRVFGVEIHASTLQSLPAIYVLIIAPMFSIAWIWLGQRGLEPATPVKFAMGLLSISLAFFSLVIGAALSGPDKVDLIWFMMAFFWLVFGELFVFPVGMSMVSRLSPKPIQGLMMGAFFFSFSLGSFIAARIAQLTAPADKTTTNPADLDFPAAKAQFADIYGEIGLLAVASALLLYAISPILTRAMHLPVSGRISLISRIYPAKFRIVRSSDQRA